MPNAHHPRAPTYAERLEAHLVCYKRERMGVFESGTWKGRNGPVKRDHILPFRRRELNILPSIRTAFWAYWRGQCRTRSPQPCLHRGFPHLTSSQAMAFNLFFPFLYYASGRSALLLEALGIPLAPIQTWGFEWVDAEDGTNVDCGMTFTTGDAVLIEVKLREREFGRCKADADHHQKFARTYAEPLSKIVAAEHLRLPGVFRNYQVLRNLWMLRRPTTRIVFLFPRENTALADGEAFLHKAPLETHRSRVSVVHLEPLVDRLLSNTAKDRGLHQHMRLFHEKYIALGVPFERGDWKASSDSWTVK
jgi:hypothetical protein